MRYPDAVAPAGWTLQLCRPVKQPASDRDHDEYRRPFALELAKKQRSKATEGGGTWQTWDWLVRHLEAQERGATVRDVELSLDVGGMDFNRPNAHTAIGETIAKTLSGRGQLSLLDHIDGEAANA